MKDHNAVTHGVVNVPTHVERPPAHDDTFPRPGGNEPLPPEDLLNRRGRRRLARLERRARLASR